VAVEVHSDSFYEVCSHARGLGALRAVFRRGLIVRPRNLGRQGAHIRAGEFGICLRFVWGFSSVEEE
jgi:hypothetical protein